MDTQPAAARAALEREAILSSLRERIIAFAASRISRDAAEDLAQEVLLLLHEKYGQVERLEELLPLSLRILRFKMMSQVRKSHRRGEYSTRSQSGGKHHRRRRRSRANATRRVLHDAKQ